MKSNASENSLLLLLYNNTAFATLGDASGVQPSAVAGSLYVGLHTGYPGEAGDQTTSEADYTGYARKAVARSGAGWTVTANQVVNAAAIEFDECTAGSNEVQYFSIGLASAGAGVILHMGLIGATTLPKPFTAKADDTITIPGNTLIVNDRCAFFAVPGGTLPTGITAGTIYHVKTVSGNDITISTTQGGSTLDLTTTGTGVVQKAVPLTVTPPIVPRFQAGAIVVAED